MHIPKTAGTALKNAFITNGAQPFTILSTHDEQIKHGDNWIIVIRDPWKRFCSAYWERRTNPLRRKINDTAPREFQRGGYQDLTSAEQQLFIDCATPDELLSKIRFNMPWWGDFLKKHYNMFQLFRPLIWYLGNVHQFEKQQHRVHMAINQQDLNDVMQNHFDIEMPTQPFLARTRKQFDIPQSYDISPGNREYFTKELYSEDYELIEYIKQQPYYTTK